MKRRSFLEILTGLTAALFLPPIRAAKALQKRIPPVPRWLTGRKHWEHLPEAIPHPGFRPFVPEGTNDARIVCRVLGPTHFHANLHPTKSNDFERGLEEAGWDSEEIARRVHPNYGEWGMSLPCEACSRRVWVPKDESAASALTLLGFCVPAELPMSCFGWQIEKTEGLWTARCPDHRKLPAA